jgi:hypothetical protein
MKPLVEEIKRYCTLGWLGALRRVHRQHHRGADPRE